MIRLKILAKLPDAIEAKMRKDLVNLIHFNNYFLPLLPLETVNCDSKDKNIWEFSESLSRNLSRKFT